MDEEGPHIDERLLREARSVSATDTDTVRLGLEALVRRGAYERLRAVADRYRSTPVTFGGGVIARARSGAQPHDCPRRHLGVDSFPVNRSSLRATLDELLGQQEVSGHESVYGELLIGDKGGRRQLVAGYEMMHQAPTVPHRNVTQFVRDRRLHRRDIGWIDAHLLASALVGRLKLWMTDPRLTMVAGELGIAYD